MTPADIVREVATETGVTIGNIRSSRRWASLVEARRICARRLREHGLSYPEIGRALGGRHHTTAMWLCGALDEYRANYLAARGNA